MFGFASKAPVSDTAREWVERSMQKFVAMFGEAQLRNVVVIQPTIDFFPSEWPSMEECIESLLEIICGHMKIDRERLTLNIIQVESPDDALKDSFSHWEGSSSDAAGTYSQQASDEKFTITIRLKPESNINVLIATIAHELGHVLLLGDRRVSREADDMEPLTDLVTVFWGFGIFTANSAIQFRQYDDGRKHGWSVQRLGYLSEEAFAYALAYFAELRYEEKPAWAKHLNTNVGTYFRQSQKYLRYQRKRRVY